MKSPEPAATGRGTLRTLVVVLLWALSLLGWSQEVTYTVPDGARHFIVMVDASRGMERPVSGDANAKPRALRRTERYLANRLFEGQNHEYRRGQDYLTVVEYGIDSRTDATQAYKRLRYASLGSDYVRIRMKASRDADRDDFLRAVRPPVRRSLNILGWAFPLCLDAASVPDLPVQQTYVIMLHDAEMNDGSVALERYNMGAHRGPQGRDRLTSAERLVWGAVRIGDELSTIEPLWQHVERARSQRIVATAWRAVPTTTVSQVSAMRDLEPLKGADLRWTNGDVRVDADIPKELVGRKGTVSLNVGNAMMSAPVELTSHMRVRLKGALKPQKDESGRLKLSVFSSARNPVLGRQRFSIDFVRAVLVPAHPSYTRAARFLSFLGWITPLILAGLLFWFLYELFVAQRVSVRLPEYPEPFPVPNPSTGAEREYRTRVPLPPGARALTVHLPPRWLRRTVYRDATIHWSEQLSMTGVEGSESPIADLPAETDLVWSSEAVSSNVCSVELIRPGPFRTQRSAVLVRYPTWYPLSDGSAEPRIRPVPVLAEPSIVPEGAE